MNIFVFLSLTVCGVAFLNGASAAGSATDKANVKVIACNNAQTISKSDKATLANNGFTKCAEPFGILVAGHKVMTDATVLETAKTMAELLDANRDGIADNPKVVEQMKCSVWMVINNKGSDSVSLNGRTSFEVDKFWYFNGVDDAKDEKQRKGVRVEECHHAITQIGYGKAYPKDFATSYGWTDTSTLVKECKKARCDWWMHPENKCKDPKKPPLLPDVYQCMKTHVGVTGNYPDNAGKACTAAQNKETCNYSSCDCIEWWHQVALILAGQKPAWISTMRNTAGLKGDKVMPTTKDAMKKLLNKKNKPLLDLWNNKKMAWRTKPMTYDYPTLKGTAPKLSACAAGGSTTATTTTVSTTVTTTATTLTTTTTTTGTDTRTDQYDNDQDDGAD